MADPTANNPDRQRITVIGAGSWGTALAAHLARMGHQVGIWAREPEVAVAINQDHENTVFLPGCRLEGDLFATNDMAQALDGAAMAVLVMPSHVYRKVLTQAAPHLPPDALLVSCTKGIEAESGYTMDEVAADVLPKSFQRSFCALSGPSFAKEVGAGMPTAVTIAGRSGKATAAAQLAFAGPLFRVYTSPDLTGVELGGAIKNPLAIAAGMIDGLGMGANTMAALVTRGLAEMTRLALAKGGQMRTIAGLAGLGDLVLTCYGGLSRNRQVGQRLAQGETIDQITTSMKMVAEGVINTGTVLNLAAAVEVEMPIIAAVKEIIAGRLTPLEGLKGLMSRDLKPEFGGGGGGVPPQS